jgi:hypothetical protein
MLVRVYEKCWVIDATCVQNSRRVDLFFVFLIVCLREFHIISYLMNYWLNFSQMMSSSL